MDISARDMECMTHVCYVYMKYIFEFGVAA
jgi:hypothetical protein